MRYDEDAVESICQHTKLNKSVHLLPDKGGIYIKTSFPQLEALLLAYIILAGPCLGETSATGMTNESSFNLEQVKEHMALVRSMNFTWLNGTSPEDGMPRGNVAGGDILAFKAELEKDGFTVQLGELKTVNIHDLVNQGVVFTCNGNNAGALYKSYVLPPAPGQTVPNIFSDKMNMSTTYRLRPDEAIIYIGNTPPNCTYFSYQSFQQFHYYPVEETFKKIFGNVGDTINLLTANISGKSQSDPFDKAIMIVSTADMGIDNRIKAAAISAGYAPEIYNTEILPSSILNMGVDVKSDGFTFLHRMTYFSNQTEEKDYMNETPGVVLRITPNQSAELNPYSMPELRVRGNGNASELDLFPALSLLRAAILEKYGKENATELITHVWLTEGYDALQRGIDVIGVTRDTTYLNSTTFKLGDDPSEFLIVYGVNHAATGKASYSNLGIFGARLDNGVAGVDNRRFEGTAEEYLPGNPAAKYLYVWKMTRNCSGEVNCTEVPTGPGSYGIGLNDTAYIVFRAYNEKETAVGPSYTEIAYDRVLKFDSV